MATVGLRFDLDPWRKGVRSAAGLIRTGLGPTVLRPFDRAVRGSVRAMRTAFARVGGFIKGILTSAFAPLIGLLAVGAAIAGIRKALTASLAAFRDYDDSVTMLRASLESLGGGIDTSAAEASVVKLGEEMRLAMGITATEVNKSFATMLTRGFDTAQARQLTILAGNYAKATGQPIENVTRLIADAANGSANAMKRLGVEIAATGDPVKDAESAVIALKAAYGDIGSDLANPSERLAAAWNALAVSLGEKISPIIEPIIQGFSDFVTGLTQTEEGKIMLDGIADTLESIVGWTGNAIRYVMNFSEVIKGTGSVIFNYLKQLFNQIMEALFIALRQLPGGDWLMEKMGFDPEFAAEAFREGTDLARREVEEASRSLMETRDRIRRGDDGAMISGLREVMEAGKRDREQAIDRLGAEMAASAGQGFAGSVAHQRAAQRVGQPQAAGPSGRSHAEIARRAKAFGGAGDGQRVSVRIMSTRPDRFRKARFA